MRTATLVSLDRTFVSDSKFPKLESNMFRNGPEPTAGNGQRSMFTGSSVQDVRLVADRYATKRQPNITFPAPWDQLLRILSEVNNWKFTAREKGLRLVPLVCNNLILNVGQPEFGAV